MIVTDAVTGPGKPRLAGFDARMLAAIVLTGIAAGVAAMGSVLVLHLIQHLCFGYTENTFLDSVERASARQRVVAHLLRSHRS